MRYAKARTEEEKKEIYDKWHDLINMSQTALDNWAEDDRRLLASFSREEAKDSGDIQSGYDSFHRIKRRKEKPFEDWTAQDFDNAAQENGFNGRMMGGKPGDPVKDSGMSKWEISLRNWGHDPSLKSSPAHAKWKAWKEKHFKKKSSLTPTTPKVSNIVRKAMRKKTACVISCLDLNDQRYLVKVRDRNYNPEIKVYHDMYDGVEVLYYIDNVTGWLEGINSYGISIVNSALNVREDEKEGQTRNLSKEPRMSEDGYYLLNALKCKNIDDAMDCIKGNSFHVPVHGHTIITDGKRARIIEQTSIHQPIVKTLQRNKLHVRTNHGINHPDAGYQVGDDRHSSLRRRELATEILSNVTDISEAAPALYGYRWDKMDDPFIPVRKVPDGLYSTSQIMFDPLERKMTVYLIPDDVDFLGYEKRFVNKDGEDTICQLEVLQYTGFDENGNFEVLPFNINPSRVASRKIASMRKYK